MNNLCPNCYECGLIQLDRYMPAHVRSAGEWIGEVEFLEKTQEYKFLCGHRVSAAIVREHFRLRALGAG